MAMYGSTSAVLFIQSRAQTATLAAFQPNGTHTVLLSCSRSTDRFFAAHWLKVAACIPHAACQERPEVPRGTCEDELVQLKGLFFHTHVDITERPGSPQSNLFHAAALAAFHVHGLRR